MFSLSPLLLAAALASGPSFAEASASLSASSAVVGESVFGDSVVGDSVVGDSVVGDSEAAHKKKAKAKKNTGGTKGGGTNGEQANDKGGDKGGTAERAPARDTATPSDPAKRTPESESASRERAPESPSRDTVSPSRDGAAPSRDTASPARESASSSRDAGSAGRSVSPAGSAVDSGKRTEVRTHSVQTGSGHQTANAASSERRPASHASPNYRGSSGKTVGEAKYIRNHDANPKNNTRHLPGVKRAAATHHAAAVRHQGYASHHAAWSAHGRPYYWYSPWRAGHPHYWYHGVFVYGPSVVVVGDGGGGEGGGGGNGGGASQARVPRRDVERSGKFSLGVRGASYLSGFDGGGNYGDAGLGLAARYRPVDALGVEVQWTYHDATWSQDTARIQQPLAISAELFAFPWSRVNPYVLAGITLTDRNIDQPLVGGTFEAEDSLWGPHAGLGLEFGIGKSASLNLDARFIGYVNKGVDDPSRAGAVQANAGLNFYF